ncbi:MAG: hypothetical protein QOE83_354 [Actinomycetota bacterium]|jgi:hypothetical protein|nr:hypothetical protein [Actinomycetota bacterium]
MDRLVFARLRSVGVGGRGPAGEFHRRGSRMKKRVA